MWPWEHLAFGYVLYSVYVRRRFAATPGAREAVALGVASQLPDLVDKPLAWWLAVLPAGRSLAHSLLVAAPLLAVVFVMGRQTNRLGVAAAVTVGYLSHLVGDVLYPLLTDLELRVGFLLWPLVPAETSGESIQFLSHVVVLAGEFLAFLGTPLGVAYLVAEVLLLGSALARWFSDGTPGLALLGLGDAPPFDTDDDGHNP